MSIDSAINPDTSIYILGGTYMHSMVQPCSCVRDKLRNIISIIFYIHHNYIITCHNTGLIIMSLIRSFVYLHSRGQYGLTTKFQMHILYFDYNMINQAGTGNQCRLLVNLKLPYITFERTCEG